MPVLTRSQLNNVLRNRRIGSKRLTIVLRSDTMDDESETDYDTESEYDPTDSDSCYTESGETESCVSADTESEDEEEYPVADNLKTKIENLRSELAEAERMLKWWEEEQRTQQMENAACLPNILLSALLSVAFVIIVGLMNAPNIHRRF
jgi:hypothetical protein